MTGVGGTGARSPMRQTFGCCARATSGQAAAALPTSVMKSRRLMYPQIEGLSVAHRGGRETAWCGTAKLIGERSKWVIFDRAARRLKSHYVGSGSNNDRI